MTAATVAELVDRLDAQWPGMRDRLCDSTPRIRRHINVFIAGERAALGTRLDDGAEVTILTAVSGGPAAAVRSAALLALDAFRAQHVEQALGVQVTAIHELAA